MSETSSHANTENNAHDVHKYDSIAIWGTIVLPCALAAVAFAATVTAASLGRLPEQMATHWSGSLAGAPDGFMTPLQSATTLLVVTVVCAQMGWFGALVRVPLVARRINTVATLLLCGFLIGMGLAVTLPQIGLADPTAARIYWSYAGTGALIGLIAGILLASRQRDFSPLADVSVTGAPAEKLPRGKPTGVTVVTCSIAVKVMLGVWALVSLVVAYFLPVLGVIFLLCLIPMLLGYRSGLEVRDSDIVVFIGVGPVKIRHTIDMRTVRYAEPGRYHWADGGGVGLRFGNDGRISVAARSGEAVKIETSGAGYTVVVPDGHAEAVSGDINSRLDAARPRAPGIAR
nr:DUF1648 domain-containing protein [Corynebacterium lactis]